MPWAGRNWRGPSRTATLIAGFNIPHIILQPMQQEVGYKTEQIVPVVTFQRTPLGLAVLKTSPYKTLKDLDRCRQGQPRKTDDRGLGRFLRVPTSPR